MLSSTAVTYLSLLGQTANINGYSIATNTTYSTLTITSVTQNLIYVCLLLDVPSGGFYYSGIYSICVKSTFYFL